MGVLQTPRPEAGNTNWDSIGANLACGERCSPALQRRLCCSHHKVNTSFCVFHASFFWVRDPEKTQKRPLFVSTLPRSQAGRVGPGRQTQAPSTEPLFSPTLPLVTRKKRGPPKPGTCPYKTSWDRPFTVAVVTHTVALVRFWQVFWVPI